MGFESILSIDTSYSLLEELNQNISDSRVRVIKGDICNINKFAEPASADVAVCMGDTITHLPRSEDVKFLIEDISLILRQDGLIVFTYRDLSSPLLGIDRLIPIMADRERIMTCVIEYGTEGVNVADLVYLNSVDGWKLYKTIYTKLILSVQKICDWIKEYNFNLLKSVAVERLHEIIAAKL